METHTLIDYLNKQYEDRIKKLNDENQLLRFRIGIESDIIKANTKEIAELKQKVNNFKNLKAGQINKPY